MLCQLWLLDLQRARTTLARMKNVLSISSSPFLFCLVSFLVCVQGSSESLYSISAKSPDLIVQGSINFSLHYRKGALRVRIVSCDNLARARPEALPSVYVYCARSTI